MLIYLLNVKKLSLIVFVILVSSTLIIAQENDLGSDELFLRARTQAFDFKDYPQAIKLSKQALAKSPNYTEISIFLGRLYTWTDQIDSAKMIFEQLDRRNVDDEDFFIAYASLAYWNDKSELANTVVDKGLSSHPTSENLLLLKAKINYGNNAYKMAKKAIDELLSINPKSTEGRALAKNIEDYAAKNAIGLTYNFVHFDKQFEDNWHIVGVNYKRATPIGSVIFRTNYANKFADNGVQFELEAYPRISKMFYLYVGAGYSDHVGIFPNYRTGVSLYANLPSSFEGEIGYRQLYFSDNIWMYTASVGKYYQNYWFNLKTYLTPGDNNISHSYTGTLRYYTKGANDYLGFSIGTGISPEEDRSILFEKSHEKLKTFKVGAEYNFSVNRTNLFSLSSTYYNQEYKINEKGNQFDFTIGYIKTF